MSNLRVAAVIMAEVAKADPLGRALLLERHSAPGAVPAALAEIDQRGPGRLIKLHSR